MKNNLAFILSAIVLFIASVYFIAQGNTEFIIYVVTLAVLIIVLYITDRYFNFLSQAKWGFFIWMVLHMAGGSLYFWGTRLYDIILIPIAGSPYNILKYDQFVHFFCYIIMTLLMYSILIKITDKKPNKIIFFIILVLAASSVGALNEIIEFVAVIVFEGSGVGGYYNTAIDLVANLLGSIFAVLYMIFFKLTNKYKEIYKTKYMGGLIDH